MSFISEPRKRRVTPELLATILLVLAYIVWILSLPAWPSQDGPAHLYYVHVMRELLSHHASVYSHYYTIKHILPPYALYYYLLLALSKICSLLLADRLILCAYLVLFVFGFRYVAQMIGPSADLSTLLAVLFALNWSAGMGFVNYCLSLALGFWAIGLWLRFSDRSLGRRLLFLLLVGAITLTHPVPLLILLAFCGVDWLQRLIFHHKACGEFRRSRLAADLVTLGLSALALLYVKHFATAHPLSQSQPFQGSYIDQVRQHVFATVRMHHLALIFGHNPPILFYLFASLALLVIAYILATVQRLRNRGARRWSASDTWLVYAVLLLILIPFLPSDLNDAFFFTERLTILVWLAPLLAVSGWTPPARTASVHPAQAAPSRPFLSAALLAFALVANLCLIWQAEDLLRPIASRMADVNSTPQAYVGELALVLEDSRSAGASGAGPSWNPFYWAGAHVLRHDEAVLDNSPWLDSAIIPLGALPTLPVAAAATGSSASPHDLSLLLRSSPAARTQMLAPVDLVLITQPGLPAPSSLDPMLAPSPGASRSWSCHLAGSWYQFCVPVRHPQAQALAATALPHP